VTKSFFLYLSQKPGLQRWMETHAVARKLTRRFVAGETLEDGLGVCASLAAEGIHTTLDHLGENVTTLDQAARARDVYLEALKEIAARGLPATVSLKLTHLGFDLSPERAEEYLRVLAERAKETRSRVEIDMEDTRYTERTVRIAERVGAEFGCIRVAIQAYLYRSAADIDALNRARVMVRLCKGAYIEPPSMAMPRKSDVDRNYVELMRKLLDEGTFAGLGTHDERMIAAALAYVRAHGIRPEQFEFQMLHGIRRDLQRQLVSEGWRVRVYVPWGSEWYRYFMRRLAERPANVLFLARNLLR
jgi:proline dehydrogenase